MKPWKFFLQNMVILMSLSMNKLIIFVVIFLVCNNQVESDSNCHLSLYLISIAHAKSSKQYMSTSRREFFSPFWKVLILIPREFFKKVFKDDGFTSSISRWETTSSMKIFIWTELLKTLQRMNCTCHTTCAGDNTHVICSQFSFTHNFVTWPDLTFSFVNERSGYKIMPGLKTKLPFIYLYY